MRVSCFKMQKFGSYTEIFQMDETVTLVALVCKVDPPPIVLFLLSVRPIALVGHPNLFIKPATVKARKNVCEFMGKTIGRVKWTRKICRVPSSRPWFLMFFFALMLCLYYKRKAHLPKFQNLLFFSYGCSTLVGLFLLIVEVSRSHSDTPHLMGLLRTRDRPIAETSTWQDVALARETHPCTSVGFEPAIPASQRPQNHAL
jgi:hypothetical protein